MYCVIICRSFISYYMHVFSAACAMWICSSNRPIAACATCETDRNWCGRKFSPTTVCDNPQPFAMQNWQKRKTFEVRQLLLRLKPILYAPIIPHQQHWWHMAIVDGLTGRNSSERWTAQVIKLKCLTISNGSCKCQFRSVYSVFFFSNMYCVRSTARLALCHMPARAGDPMHTATRRHSDDNCVRCVRCAVCVFMPFSHSIPRTGMHSTFVHKFYILHLTWTTISICKWIINS